MCSCGAMNYMPYHRFNYDGRTVVRRLESAVKNTLDFLGKTINKVMGNDTTPPSGIPVVSPAQTMPPQSGLPTNQSR